MAYQFAGASCAMYNIAYIKSDKIAFVDSDPDTITLSEGSFVDHQFLDGDVITVVSTSGTNDGDYTIDDTVIDGTITLASGDSLTAETAATAGVVIIYKKTITSDDQTGGLNNFNVTENIEKIETTTLGMGSLTDTTIASVDSNPDTFTDTGNRFITKQFIIGDIVTVSGYTGGNTGNNGDKTVTNVAAGTLTIAESLSAVGAGGSITIKKKYPVLWETSMPGKYSWTATAEQLWNTTNGSIFDLMGKLQIFRFYDADYYKEGIGYISSPGGVSNISDLIRDNVTIVGVGVLVPHAVV
jgi:hypothetical protein